MGLTRVTVKLTSLSLPNGAYEAEFLIDTGVTDSLVPAYGLIEFECNQLAERPMNSQMERSRSIPSALLRLLLWTRSLPVAQFSVRTTPSQSWE